VATTRALQRAGVPVLPTVGVVPGDGVQVSGVLPDRAMVVKPARASKARGVQSFTSVDEAQGSLRAGRELVAGMVDHQLVQPRASGAGCDYRVVVADGEVVAVTCRQAPTGEFITNHPDGTVDDVFPPFADHRQVVEVAVAAAEALELDFAGVDVIHHDGRAVVLEVNAWPGLAAAVRNDQLARSLVEVARRRLTRP
jgi:glutathione synthase/RimK-type ligase-like ATP-grasp enzyme